MKAPFIGVTGVTRNVSGADRVSLNAAYPLAVLRAGGIPLVLSPLIGTGHNEEILDAIDGLVLSGGEDIDPAFYNQPRHPRLGDVDPVRDAFEIALFRDAQVRALPVLAICRGIQLVNVALGGTLWQDIPSEVPGALNHNPGTERDARTHLVEITPGSRLAAALGGTRFEVNSFHHQAIRDLAPGLAVTATSPDGIIEGGEGSAQDPWLLAVQWHPEEFHRQDEAPDHGLFGALMKQARDYRRQEVVGERAGGG
jgi:putative glutamine amidotransferase